MIFEAASERGFGKVGAAFALACLALALIVIVFARPLRRYVRESLMQRVTSAHYQILCPPGALSQEAMTQFATQREMLFVAVDQKLNDAASNSEIRVIFDPDFKAGAASTDEARAYDVTATTVRIGLSGRVPQLDPAADEVEQRVGHKQVASLLGQSPDAGISPQDRALLGAAWVNAIAEFGGAAEVRKLYSAKTTKLDLAEVTKALGTTSTELERKWQMWMYAYIAGMPPAGHSMGMPMAK